MYVYKMKIQPPTQRETRKTYLNLNSLISWYDNTCKSLLSFLAKAILLFAGHVTQEMRNMHVHSVHLLTTLHLRNLMRLYGRITVLSLATTLPEQRETQVYRSKSKAIDINTSQANQHVSDTYF